MPGSTPRTPAKASRAKICPINSAPVSGSGYVAQAIALPELTAVLDREEAVHRFELPADRIGDIVMISGENMTIGTSAHRHDLAALKEPLRSHGGLTEQEVPFIVNRVMPDLPNEPSLRNFDAFYYATRAAAL